MLELYFFEHVLLHLLVKWALSKILYHIILKEAKFRYRFAWEECNHEGRKKYTYNHHDLFAVYVWGSLYNLSVCDVSRNWVNILVTLPFKGNLMRAAGMYKMFCTLRIYDELLFIYIFFNFQGLSMCPTWFRSRPLSRWLTFGCWPVCLFPFLMSSFRLRLSLV